MFSTVLSFIRSAILSASDWMLSLFASIDPSVYFAVLLAASIPLIFRYIIRPLMGGASDAAADDIRRKRK